MWSPALPRRAPRCTDCRISTVIAVAAVIGQPVNQHPTVTDRTIRREVVRGHEPSLGLDDCEGSTGLVRGDSPMSAIGTTETIDSTETGMEIHNIRFLRLM